MEKYTINLLNGLNQLADKKNAIAMSKYMRNQFDFLGIKTPERRAFLKKYIDQEGLPHEGIFHAVTNELWTQPYREGQYCAIELLAKNKKKWKKKDLSHFVQLATQKSWWDSVDGIQGRLIGPYFEIFADELIPMTKKWNKSDNIWLQRLSIIAQLSFKEKTNEDLLFEHILNRADSKEFFVQKAIGWSLRQYARTKPRVVWTFVQNSQLQPLSKREALKHF